MITARGRIHLDDLEPIAPPLEPNAVIVAERFGRSGDGVWGAMEQASQLSANT
jgi:hypothetical protein